MRAVVAGAGERGAHGVDEFADGGGAGGQRGGQAEVLTDGDQDGLHDDGVDAEVGLEVALRPQVALVVQGAGGDDVHDAFADPRGVGECVDGVGHAAVPPSFCRSRSTRAQIALTDLKFCRVTSGSGTVTRNSPCR